MVRLAKENELKKVNEIRQQVHMLHYSGRPDIFTENFSNELHDSIYSFFNGESSDVIVALKDNKICGFACVKYVAKPSSPYTNERSYYNVVEFGVDEHAQRHGIGTELFTYIKQSASDKGFDKIELDVWEFNESALKFYEAAGFVTYRRYLEFNI